MVILLFSLNLHSFDTDLALRVLLAILCPVEVRGEEVVTLQGGGVRPCPYFRKRDGVGDVGGRLSLLGNLFGMNALQ